MATTTRFWKRKLITAKIETTYGSDASPTASANAIEARNVSFTPLDASYVTNDAELPYFGNSPEVPVSQAARLTFDVVLQGSGTAGTAPPSGPLLRGCGLAETILAAPVTGTAQAGGANTITLAAGASAIDNAYRGLYLTTTGGTGSGQAGVVVAYNGTTKVATMMDAWTTPPDATTQYSIAAQVGYGTISTGFEALSQYMYIDGLLHKMLGVRGSVTDKITPKGLAMLSFDFVGLFGTVSDQTLPTPTLSAWKTGNPVNNVYTSGFKLHGFAANFYDMQNNLGNQVKHRDDVVGTEDVLITGRAPSGSVLIQAPLLAEKDYFTIAKNATLGSLFVTHGTAAGLRVRRALPSVQLKSPKYQDKDGVAAMAFDTRPLPTYGNDESFFIFD